MISSLFFFCTFTIVLFSSYQHNWLIFRFLSFSELDTAGLDHVASESTNLSPIPSADLQNKSFHRSSSNPDLASVSTGNTSTHEEEESAFVVKVYRSDQSFKYFPIHKVKRKEKRKSKRFRLQDTTAQQLVMLAMSEFGLTEHSRLFLTSMFFSSNSGVLDVIRCAKFQLTMEFWNRNVYPIKSIIYLNV